MTYMKSMLQFQLWVRKRSLWVGGSVSQIKLLTDWKVTEEASISGEKARSVHGEEMKSGLRTVFPADCRRQAWGEPRGLLASTKGQPATLLPVAAPTPPTLPTPAHSSPHPTPPWPMVTNLQVEELGFKPRPSGFFSRPPASLFQKQQ